MEENVFAPPLDFLAGMAPSAREELAALGERQVLYKDQIVFHAGSPGTHVHVLFEGRMKIFQLSSVGKEVILWFCFPGEIFGLAEIMRGQRRQVYAQACCDSEILTIHQRDFKLFLSKHASVALQVIDLLAGRLRGLGDVILNMAAEDVTSRVIKLISRLGARYGKPVDDGALRLEIPLTHQEIADMIGTSRQTVSAVLSMLRRKGVIRVQNHAIYIQQPEWLANGVQVASLTGEKRPEMG